MQAPQGKVEQMAPGGPWQPRLVLRGSLAPLGTHYSLEDAQAAYDAGKLRAALDLGKDLHALKLHRHAAAYTAHPLWQHLLLSACSFEQACALLAGGVAAGMLAPAEAAERHLQAARVAAGAAAAAPTPATASAASQPPLRAPAGAAQGETGTGLAAQARNAAVGQPQAGRTQRQQEAAQKQRAARWLEYPAGSGQYARHLSPRVQQTGELSLPKWMLAAGFPAIAATPKGSVQLQAVGAGQAGTSGASTGSSWAMKSSVWKIKRTEICFLCMTRAFVDAQQLKAGDVLVLHSSPITSITFRWLAGSAQALGFAAFELSASGTDNPAIPVSTAPAGSSYASDGHNRDSCSRSSAGQRGKKRRGACLPRHAKRQQRGRQLHLLGHATGGSGSDDTEQQKTEEGVQQEEGDEEGEEVQQQREEGEGQGQQPYSRNARWLEYPAGSGSYAVAFSNYVVAKRRLTLPELVRQSAFKLSSANGSIALAFPALAPATLPAAGVAATASDAGVGGSHHCYDWLFSTKTKQTEGRKEEVTVTANVPSAFLQDQKAKAGDVLAVRNTGVHSVSCQLWPAASPQARAFHAFEQQAPVCYAGSKKANWRQDEQGSFILTITAAIARVCKRITMPTHFALGIFGQAPEAALPPKVVTLVAPDGRQHTCSTSMHFKRPYCNMSGMATLLHALGVQDGDQLRFQPAGLGRASVMLVGAEQQHQQHQQQLQQQRLPADTCNGGAGGSDAGEETPLPPSLHAPHAAQQPLLTQQQHYREQQMLPSSGASAGVPAHQPSLSDGPLPEVEAVVGDEGRLEEALAQVFAQMEATGGVPTSTIRAYRLTLQGIASPRWRLAHYCLLRAFAQRGEWVGVAAWMAQASRQLGRRLQTQDEIAG